MECQHIYQILRFMNWCMVKLATVDLARCAILERMVQWFSNEKVEDCLTGVDRSLLFDADETQITLEEKTPQKVLNLSKGKKNTALVPRANRASSHITLFLAVSAAGDVMKPYVLLSKFVRNFDPLNNKDVVHYHADKGFMTQELCYQVMKGVFVRHVETVRVFQNLIGKRDVLVVDGHASR